VFRNKLKTFLIPVFIFIIFFPACSKLGIFNDVFAPQEWSENYSLLEGVQCTSPKMIDGKRETIGKTGREIIIELPERKSIHKIIIYDTNIEDLILYKWTGNKWIKETKVINNNTNKIEIRTGIATKKIRFRIGETFDDERIARKISPVTGKVVGDRVKLGNPVASEIELYGFVRSDKSTEKEKPKEEEMLF